jgi:hypothetical protein
MNIPNIGPKGRRRRLVMGLTIWLVAFGLAAAMIFAGADRSWRWLLFILFWLGALSIFQAAEKT